VQPARPGWSWGRGGTSTEAVSCRLELHSAKFLCPLAALRSAWSWRGREKPTPVSQIPTLAPWSVRRNTLMDGGIALDALVLGDFDESLCASIPQRKLQMLLAQTFRARDGFPSFSGRPASVPCLRPFGVGPFDSVFAPESAAAILRGRGPGANGGMGWFALIGRANAADESATFPRRTDIGSATHGKGPGQR